MITKTPSELTTTITTQKELIIENQKQISDLNLKINCLDDSIVKMAEQYNQKSIDREKVYAKKMLEQQKYVNDAIDEISKMMSNRNTMLKSEPLLSYKMETDSIVEMPTKMYMPEENSLNVDSVIKIKLKNIKKFLKNN